MAQAINPYEDGLAASHIMHALLGYSVKSFVPLSFNNIRQTKNYSFFELN